MHVSSAESLLDGTFSPEGYRANVSVVKGRTYDLFCICRRVHSKYGSFGNIFCVGYLFQEGYNVFFWQWPATSTWAAMESCVLCRSLF